MKNHIIKNILLLSILSVIAIACEKWTNPESITIQGLTPDKIPLKSNEYWENLRAYKKSDHAIAFGWFGEWSGQGTSISTSLAGIPDSVDMVSIWGHWNNLTAIQKKDMELVQQVKGTKVLMCFIVGNVGDGLGMPNKYWGELSDTTKSQSSTNLYKDHPAAIKKYVVAIVDTILKYNYDGFDIDYEPTVGAPGNIATDKNNMAIFVTEMGKYLGPKSSSGKILDVDGQPDYLLASVGVYLDYFISQAYACTSYSNLESRCNSMRFLAGFTPKKYIVTENFESYWSTGGVTFTDRNGIKMASLLGMAGWNPLDSRKGGAGTYHMEYEFPLNPDYNYLRKAIQIMNPAIK